MHQRRAPTPDRVTDSGLTSWLNLHPCIRALRLHDMPCLGVQKCRRKAKTLLDKADNRHKTTTLKTVEGDMPLDMTAEPDIIIDEEELIALATETGTVVVDSDDCCDCVV